MEKEKEDFAENFWKYMEGSRVLPPSPVLEFEKLALDPLYL